MRERERVRANEMCRGKKLEGREEDEIVSSVEEEEKEEFYVFKYIGGKVYIYYIKGRKKSK